MFLCLGEHFHVGVVVFHFQSWDYAKIVNIFFEIVRFVELEGKKLFKNAKLCTIRDIEGYRSLCETSRVNQIGAEFAIYGAPLVLLTGLSMWIELVCALCRAKNGRGKFSQYSLILCFASPSELARK